MSASMATAAPSATRGRGGNENRSNLSQATCASPSSCAGERRKRNKRKKKGNGRKKKRNDWWWAQAISQTRGTRSPRIQRNRTNRARPAEDSPGLPAGNVSLIQRLCLNDKSSGLPANKKKINMLENSIIIRNI